MITIALMWSSKIYYQTPSRYNERNCRRAPEKFDCEPQIGSKLAGSLWPVNSSEYVRLALIESICLWVYLMYLLKQIRDLNSISKLVEEMLIIVMVYA